MKRNPILRYVVQPGDNLYSIAIKFNTSVESIFFLNHLVSPNIYIGQTLLIPNQTLKKGIEVRQMEYRPVTAYTATRPILVNGVDINTGLYPVLNFKPEGATYPYIYVPIAEFTRVGAEVVWDPVNQVITVTSDYDKLKNQVNLLTEENQYLLSLINDVQMDGLGNTIGNILNNGFIAKESDWLYYNKRQGTSLYGYLSKIKTDLTMDTRLVSDEPTYTNVLNGWVYYRNGREDGKIYKIKTDGTERTKITDDSSTNIIVRGDWIYYANQSDGAKIYKIKIDGTHPIDLHSKSNHL
jgi:LysM repeat protein